MSRFKVTFIELKPNTRQLLPDIATVMGTENRVKSNEIFDFKQLSKNEISNQKGIFDKLINAESSSALWNLAACYDLGHECTQNMVEAKRYYRMAYVQKGLDNGTINLNDLSLNQLIPGWYQFMLPDVPEAYEAASNMEYPYANYFLGMCYLNALGVEENDCIANQHFEKARKLGCTVGTKALANSYLRGYGVVQNQEIALSLFKEAYELGDKGGGLNYAAILYNNGNRSAAIKLMRKLANEGFQPAIDTLKQINI